MTQTICSNSSVSFGAAICIKFEPRNPGKGTQRAPHVFEGYPTNETDDLILHPVIQVLGKLLLYPLATSYSSHLFNKRFL